MIKTCISFCVLMFVFFAASAQSSFSEVQNPQAELHNLMEANKNVTSISCDFVQKKELSILSETVTSEGIFRLKGNDKLLWEYRTPYPYKVVINGDRMEIDDSENKMTFDTRSNRMFREISNIMIKSVDGSIVTDKSTFETKLLENKTELLAELTPKTRELSGLFDKISLRFDKSNYLVRRIDMYEELGDVTTIILNNQKLNEPVEDSCFFIRK